MRPCPRLHDRLAVLGLRRGQHPLEIGTTGQSLAIEAVEFQTQSGSITVNAHLAGYGWQGWRSGAHVTVRTTGENRAIEAIMITA